MKKHKKVALIGLGSKYGATVRKRYSRVYRTSKLKHVCPVCGSHKFRRVAVGIWSCPVCNFKIASGAYNVSVERK